MQTTTDREKLVEMINKGVEIYSDGYQIKIAAAETIADHLIANGVTVQRWVPVTERLPGIKKEAGLIQITETVQATDGQKTFFGHFKVYKPDKSWTFVCATEDVDLCVTDEITHWIPPHDLPKEVPHEKH